MANEVPWSAKLPKCMVGDKAAEKGGLPHVHCPTCAKYSAVPHNVTQCHTVQSGTQSAQRVQARDLGGHRLDSGNLWMALSATSIQPKTTTTKQTHELSIGLELGILKNHCTAADSGFDLLDLRCTLHCGGRISWKDSKSYSVTASDEICDRHRPSLWQEVWEHMRHCVKDCCGKKFSDC